MIAAGAGKVCRGGDQGLPIAAPAQLGSHDQAVKHHIAGFGPAAVPPPRHARKPPAQRPAMGQKQGVIQPEKAAPRIADPGHCRQPAIGCARDQSHLGAQSRRDQSGAAVLGDREGQDLAPEALPI